MQLRGSERRGVIQDTVDFADGVLKANFENGDDPRVKAERGVAILGVVGRLAGRFANLLGIAVSRYEAVGEEGETVNE